VLITVAGVVFYGTTVLLSRWALRHWHESQLDERIAASTSSAAARSAG
jgi:hypothetical protein